MMITNVSFLSIAPRMSLRISASAAWCFWRLSCLTSRSFGFAEWRKTALSEPPLSLPSRVPVFNRLLFSPHFSPRVLLLTPRHHNPSLLGPSPCTFLSPSLTRTHTIKRRAHDFFSSSLFGVLLLSLSLALPLHPLPPSLLRLLVADRQDARGAPRHRHGCIVAAMVRWPR